MIRQFIDLPTVRMKMLRTTILQFAALQVLFILLGVGADYIPPSRFDGFVYGKGNLNLLDTVLIEAFYDPVCPDSRDSWPPLKQALHHYSSRVSFLLHLLPLPLVIPAYFLTLPFLLFSSLWWLLIIFAVQLSQTD